MQHSAVPFTRRGRHALSRRVIPGSALVALALFAGTAHASTVTLRPTADTQVGAKSKGSRSLGRAQALHAGGRDLILLRFDATRAPASISNASLEVYARAKKKAALKVSKVKPGRKWSEQSATRRPAAGAKVAQASVKGAGWVRLDVTKAVTPGVVEFVISSPAAAGLTVRSRETSSAPRLVLTTPPPPVQPRAPQPPATAQPTPTPTATPTTTPAGPPVNPAPALTAPAGQTASEGTSKNFALGSFTDPGSSSWTAKVEWGDGASDPVFAAIPGALPSTAHTYADDGTYTAKVTITDNGGAATARTFAVAVANVAPTATLSGPAEAAEGTTKTYTYTVSDPGADTATVATSCGDGEKVATGADSVDCRFPDGPIDTAVTATPTDSDNATGTTAAKPVHVTNVAPSITLTGPASVDEGSTKTYTYSVSDPGADTVSVVTDCGTGASKSSSGASSFECTFPDGPAGPEPSATATDSDGAATTATRHVDVTNVAPTATLGNDGPVTIDAPVHVTFGDQSDPSVADAATLRYALHCDGAPFDGAPDFGAAGTSATSTCTFGTTGTHKVVGLVMDRNGAFNTYETDVVVNPAPDPDPAAVYLSPTGADADPCTKAAPCLSFDRGYHAAGPGEVVQVAAGSYGPQTITKDAGKSGGAPVVIRPAAGATVTVAGVSVAGASRLTLAGLDVDGEVGVENTTPETPGSENVTFDHVNGKSLTVVGRVAHVSFLGGTYGDTLDDQSQIKKYNPGDADEARPLDVLVDGVTFRHFKASAPGTHTECLQVSQVDTLTVRNSRFDDCDGTAHLAMTDGPSDHVTIENNFFGKTGDSPFALQLTKNQQDLLLRNNSASKEVIFSDAEAGGPYRLTGNYVPYHPRMCTADAEYRHNVTAGGRCATTDVSVSRMKFVDEDGFDLHLAPNSEAIDRGDPDSYPAKDIDGETRFIGAAPDAGADEHDASGDPARPTTVYVDAEGSDAAPCTEAAPCQTFQRGYEEAPSGGTVLLSGGDFPAQVLSRDDTKTGPTPVVIRPAEGATPVVQTLRVEGASYVTVKDVVFTGGVHVENSDPAADGSTFVTFDGLTGERFTITGRVSHIAVRRGSYGDALDSTPVIKRYNPDDPDVARPTDITVEDTSLHDFAQSPNEGDTACLRVTGVDGLVVRRSRFHHCAGAGDLDLASGRSDHVTLENNFLGGLAGFGVQVGTGVRNLVLRYNSASVPVIFAGKPDGGGTYELVGNYLPWVQDTCVEDGIFRGNVFASDTGTAVCGGMDFPTDALRFVDVAGGDLHLAPGSDARGKGDEADLPATDIDGQPRPQGDLPDAGADEVE